MGNLYSNEIVFSSHPDKVCDRISAALLEEYLIEDKFTRAGIEVVGGKGKIFITGEVTSKANINVEAVVRDVLIDAGYETADSPKYEIENNIGLQSADIALGTNEDVMGAGDQGLMFGYATRETKELLPKAQAILCRFAEAYDELREKDDRFKSDGKAQITGEYDEDGKLTDIYKFLVSYQNTELEREDTDRIIFKLARDCCAEYGLDLTEEEMLINPTGKFEIGGFDGDAGLTGRKIVVDQYQGFVKVGGGNLNGKDPTKVDLSGTYMARKLAALILDANPEINEVEVQVAYAIGLAYPLSININTDIGPIQPTTDMYERCTPANIIKEFNLRDFNYEDAAKYGHIWYLAKNGYDRNNA